MRSYLRSKVGILLVLVLLFGPAAALAQPQGLVLLTTSDLQGQMEPFETVVKGAKVQRGGMARLAAVLKAARAVHPPRTLMVATGDDLMGRYFLQFHGRAMYGAMNAAGVQAATWGNHEFDLGPQVFVEALKSAGFPMVVSNLTAPAGSPLAGKFSPLLMLNRGGLRVGLFGLMTPDLPDISKVQGSVRISQDIFAAARQSVAKLKEQGADLVVALTHIGLDLDQKLAARVAGIDVICGGHSHTLLPTGKEVLASAPDGRRTIIVQTGSRGAHVGKLTVWVDKGRVVEHQWEAIPITESISPDPAVAEVVAAYKAQLPAALVIARLESDLDCRRDTVRTREAAAGNFIADLMRGQFKTDAAVLNGGNIRGDRVIPAGPLTTADTQTMLPFGNEIDILALKGEVLWEALNWGLSGLKQGEGRFLQVSGLRFKVKAGRVQEAWVQASDGKYLPLAQDRTYSVAVTTFLADGGDGFRMLPAKALSRKMTYVSLESLVQAKLKDLKTISPKKEGRIIFVD